jgi:hypothetical protein
MRPGPLKCETLLFDWEHFTVSSDIYCAFLRQQSFSKANKTYECTAQRESNRVKGMIDAAPSIHKRVNPF